MSGKITRSRNREASDGVYGRWVTSIVHQGSSSAWAALGCSTECETGADKYAFAKRHRNGCGFWQRAVHARVRRQSRSGNEPRCNAKPKTLTFGEMSKLAMFDTVWQELTHLGPRLCQQGGLICDEYPDKIMRLTSLTEPGKVTFDHTDHAMAFCPPLGAQAGWSHDGSRIQILTANKLS